MRTQDPGHLAGNVEFAYLDAFDPDQPALAEMKAHYVRGGLADRVVKARLEACLQELLAPIRSRGEKLSQDRSHVIELLKLGTEKAREVAARTTDEANRVLGLRYFWVTSR